MTNTELKAKLAEIKGLAVSKSERMRRMYDLGLYVCDIAKVMGTSQQFVDNVIETHVGRENMRKKSKSGTDSFSSKYRADFGQGLTVSQVARKYNKSDSSVHNVYKKWVKAGGTVDLKAAEKNRK